MYLRNKSKIVNLQLATCISVEEASFLGNPNHDLLRIKFNSGEVVFDLPRGKGKEFLRKLEELISKNSHLIYGVEEICSTL